MSHTDSVTPDQIDGYRGFCVKPTGGTLTMCREAASHVGVRHDGWVSGTTWCERHVSADTPVGWMFRWVPIVESGV